MKMLLISLFLLSFCLLQSLTAQSIIVQRGNQSFAYATLSEAIANANNGDILYLPPGNFDVSGIQINKGIHIIGAGYNPTTTGATGQTNISGNLVIVKGADGGSIQGMNILNSVLFGIDSSSSEVKNYTITRCFIAGKLFLTYAESQPSKCSNIIITENILYNLDGGYANNVIVTNNIITQNAYNIVTFFKNAIFANNIFLTREDFPLNRVYSCVFKNNIIAKGVFACSSWDGGSGNILINNLYSSSQGLSTNGVVQYEGNVFLERSKMFVNAEEDDFRFPNDYQLTQAALKAITGTDGTQVGIYGGQYPFKEGAAPVNPQIIEKKISTTTNPKGKLNVQIKVKAQNK
jgi:hypothetical protein